MKNVNLDKLVQDFNLLEQKISELNGKNNMLEIKLEATNRLLMFSQNKEKHLSEVYSNNFERDVMMSIISGLQHIIQQQCGLRVENEELKSSVLDMKKQNDALMQESDAHVRSLEDKLRALQEQHQREMDDCVKKAQMKLQYKDTEMKEALERKENVLEEIRKKMKEQEKEKQSEIIKLQMEFSAKLARAQSMSVKTHQQPQDSVLQNIFKRKLQFLQEEKNREIAVLRQKVKELELQGFSEPRLKQRRI